MARKKTASGGTARTRAKAAAARAGRKESTVTTPVAGPEMFAKTGRAAVLSQAALMLMLGRQLRGDAAVNAARAAVHGRGPAARTAAAGAVRVAGTPAAEAVAAAAGAAAAAEPGAEEFPVPRLAPTPERFAPAAVSARLATRHAFEASAAAAQPEAAGRTLAAVAERLFRFEEPAVAVELMEACLHHPEELVRVAAAIAYYRNSTAPSRLLPVIVQGARSADRLTRDVAATALARIDPAHPRLAELAVPAPVPGVRPPSQTALLVHGTWAAEGGWWMPGEDFHGHLLNGIRPDLYAAADYFHWSGSYSEAARDLGAEELAAWVRDRGFPEPPDLFCHSHGGSIAMQANAAGMDIGLLVLLSCPVHVDRYFPDFTRVRRVVSIRVKYDLVIMADFGGQEFDDARIEENVLPVWFNHSASHYPDVWDRRNVADMVELRRRPAVERTMWVSLLFRAAWIWFCRAAWRLTGLRWFGRRLVRALDSRQETVRMLAALFLTRAGRRAEPLLREALAGRRSLPIVLAILGDIGDRTTEGEIERFRNDPEPAVARAAQQALRVLNARN